jgi:hypothetical protein
MATLSALKFIPEHGDLETKLKRRIQMRKTWSMVPLLWLAMLLLLPGAARAQQVLFTTFGPNDSHDSGGTPFGSVLGPDGPPYVPFVGRADAFTLPCCPFTGTYGFSRLDFAIGDLSNNPDGGPPPYVFRVQLTADASGMPGTVLETWTVSSPTSNSPTGIFTVYDSLQLELVAERQYWVTVNSTNALASGTWFGYDSHSGLIAFNFGGDGGWNTLHGYQGALNVWGTTISFFLPPIGLVANQILRVLVTGGAPPGRNRAQANLGLIDLDGKAIGPSLPVTINPGEIVSVEFPANDYIKRPGERLEVVPVISSLPNPNAALGAGGRIQASVEVRDAATGSGTIFTSVPTAPPDPLAPVLAAQSLEHGQTMLINVMALPDHPCIARLNFADKEGRPLRPSKLVDVPAGTGMSFDLNADTLGLKLGERIDVRPIVTLTAPPVTSPTAASPRIDSACQASVEVFDQKSGRTETYQAARVQSPAVR